MARDRELTTCRCGKSWSGKRIEHCPCCHETFTGSSAGDMHRVGRHEIFSGPKRRRCLDPIEMWAKGMRVNIHGYWTSGGESEWLRAKKEYNSIV